MVLNQINYKMPIYKDCTLFELLAVSIAYLVIGGMVLSMITRLMFGYGSIGAAITLLTLVHVTRFVLGRLQRIKYGKPYGYYQQLFFKKISASWLRHVWQAPHIVREGRWSIRREN